MSRGRHLIVTSRGNVALVALGGKVYAIGGHGSSSNDPKPGMEVFTP